VIPVLAKQSVAEQMMTTIVALAVREAMCPPVRMV
jgi:hypothetical protein